MRRVAFLAGIIILAIALFGRGALRDYFATLESENQLYSGFYYLNNGKQSQAVAHFSRAVALRPAGDIWGRIGLAYHYKQQFGEALPWLERARAANPRQPWAAQVALAAGYAATNQPLRGDQLMARARANMPNDPGLLNNQAYPMADAGILLNDTIVMLVRAVELAPDNPMVLDSLGWAYFRKGEYQRAAEFLQKAVSFSPEPNKEIISHLNQAQKALKATGASY